MLVLRLHGAEGRAFDGDGFGIALKVCDDGICAAFAGDVQIRAGPSRQIAPAVSPSLSASMTLHASLASAKQPMMARFIWKGSRWNVTSAFGKKRPASRHYLSPSAPRWTRSIFARSYFFPTVATPSLQSSPARPTKAWWTVPRRLTLPLSASFPA